jgi:hypothetical protein
MLTMLPAYAEQVRNRGLRQEEIRIEVHRHNPAILLTRHFGGVLREVDTGHVPEDVEPAEALDASRDCSVAGVRVTEVVLAHLNRSRGHAQRLDEPLLGDVDGKSGTHLPRQGGA